MAFVSAPATVTRTTGRRAATTTAAGRPAAAAAAPPSRVAAGAAGVRAAASGGFGAAKKGGASAAGGAGTGGKAAADEAALDERALRAAEIHEVIQGLVDFRARIVDDATVLAKKVKAPRKQLEVRLCGGVAVQGGRVESGERSEGEGRARPAAVVREGVGLGRRAGASMVTDTVWSALVLVAWASWAPTRVLPHCRRAASPPRPLVTGGAGVSPRHPSH